MATPQPFRVTSVPGIKRDSTVFEGPNYTDGLWNRFTRRGNPRKIAGYKSITSHLSEIVRGINSFAIDATNYLHLGSQSFLTQVQTDFAGNLGAQTNRTPSGFIPNVNNLWQVDAFYNKVGGATAVVAHAGQNLSDIAGSTESPIYYGPIDGTGALTASAMDPVSGGILPVPPYLLAFSNGGRVDVSATNDLTSPTANSTFVTAQKIVRGLALRNSSTPAGILWSLDTLVTAVFDPSLTAASGIPTFDFNEVATISILSSRGPVELDSIYYWPGVDRFWMYNGIARELPNNMNTDFFFENVNFAQRQKAFSFTVPRWGEVWFCAPLFGASECNWAIIYNTILQTWYDTPLPDGGRSAGIFAKVFQFPYMCDVDQTSTGYTLWQHETGLDKVQGTSVLPIPAYYQTHEMSPIDAPQNAVDKAFRVGIIEPDFVQSGDITCTVFARANARVAPVASANLTIPAAPILAGDPGNQVSELKWNGRLLSFRFGSNTPGGNYEAGKVMAHMEVTDGRFTQ